MRILSLIQIIYKIGISKVMASVYDVVEEVGGEKVEKNVMAHAIAICDTMFIQQNTTAICLFFCNVLFDIVAGTIAFVVATIYPKIPYVFYINILLPITASMVIKLDGTYRPLKSGQVCGRQGIVC